MAKKQNMFETSPEDEKIALKVELGKRGTDRLRQFCDKPPEWFSKDTYEVVTTDEKFLEIMDRCVANGIHGSDTETNGLDLRLYQHPDDPKKAITNHQVVGLCIAPDTKSGYYIPLRHKVGKNLDPQFVFSKYAEVIKKSKPIFHNSAFDLQALLPEGIEIFDPSQFEDTFVAAKLGDDGVIFKRRFDLKSMGKDYLNVDPLSFAEVLKHKIKNKIYETTFDYLDSTYAHAYAAVDALSTLKLWSVVQKMPFFAKQPGIYHLEKSVIPIVNEMVYTHRLFINTPYVRYEAKKIEALMEENIKRMHELAGEEFAPNSPKQVSEVLFNTLKLPTKGIQKNNNGYATGEAILQKIIDKHEIVQKILDHRHYTKQLGTYAVGFLEDVDKYNTLSCGLRPLGPDTGRFAGVGSKNPEVDGTSRISVLTIPKNRTGEGIDFRQAIQAPPGYVLLIADYSGEELRIFANMSGDETWVNKLSHEDDVHKSTAALFHGVPEDKVTKTQRQDGKAANFLIIYGGSYFKLSQSFNLTIEEAQERYDRIMAGMKKGKTFIDGRRKFAQKHGYAKTYFGRIRALPHANDSDRKKAAAAGRQATNTPIQGTGADILKILLVKLRKHSRKMNWDERFNEVFKIILPVHDEVVCAVRIDKAEEVLNDLMDLMQSVSGKDWPVPLSVEAEISDSWSTGNATSLIKHKGKIMEASVVSALAKDKFSDRLYPNWDAREYLLTKEDYSVNIQDLVDVQVKLRQDQLQELKTNLEKNIILTKEQTDKEPTENTIITNTPPDKEVRLKEFKISIKEKENTEGVFTSSDIHITIQVPLTEGVISKLKRTIKTALGGDSGIVVRTECGESIIDDNRIKVDTTVLLRELGKDD